MRVQTDIWQNGGIVMPDRKNYFFVDNGKGQKTKYRGLFSYHSDDFERDYIFYTDDIKDKNCLGNILYMRRSPLK